MEKQSVTKLFEVYLSIQDYRESSLEILGRAVRWYLELNSDSSITQQGVDDYRAWLLKGRSRSSANTYLRMIKPFFKWIARRQRIQEPKIKLYRQGSKKFRIYEADEISRIFDVADLRFRCIVALALSGMRRAEILNLAVRDVDFEKALILLSPKRDSETTWAWEIKNSKMAYIGISSYAVRWLSSLLERIPDKQPYLIVPPGHYQRLIETKKHKRLSYHQRYCPYGNFNRKFNNLLKRAKVTPKRFHSLRDTFGTDQYREWKDIKIMQQLMRHSSIQTTANYIESMDSQELAVQSAKISEKYYYVTNET